jgi:hypothetical protein
MTEDREYLAALRRLKAWRRQQWKAILAGVPAAAPPPSQRKRPAPPAPTFNPHRRYTPYSEDRA